MNRRGFVKRIGQAAAVAAVAPEVIAAPIAAPATAVKAVETVTSYSVGSPSVVSAWVMSTMSTSPWPIQTCGGSSTLSGSAVFSSIYQDDDYDDDPD